uniref:Uncharacterized protein n=1 Tax=Lepeophtheirus salmonis TaxID=72036 RepID=A0A0K2TJZ9_LEPSM
MISYKLKYTYNVVSRKNGNGKMSRKKCQEKSKET